MQEVSIFQWIALVLGAAGFVITWTRTAVSITRAVDKIESDTTSKITSELAKIMEQFNEDQKTQDNRVAEVGLSVRQYIANVEKEMHQIEIWSRDHFVLKADFMKTAERLENAITNMTSDIKSDLRLLTTKI